MISSLATQTKRVRVRYYNRIANATFIAERYGFRLDYRSCGY